MKFFGLSRGFTLIECVIALLLLSLMLGIALPQFTQLQHYHQLRSQVSALIELLVKARQLSLSEGQTVYAHSINDATQGWAVALHLDSTARTWSQLQQHSLATASGKYVELGFTQAVLGFSHLHGRPVIAGHYRFNFAGEANGIKVIYHNVSGRVRVCHQGGKRYGYPAC